MTLAITSLNAYHGEIKETLGERQRQVLNIIRNSKNITNKEIANILKVDTCSITGRVKELRDYGLIFEDEKRNCNITGRLAMAWKIQKTTLF
jgi:Mn-dependent DtxR family transcriptional regulator